MQLTTAGPDGIMGWDLLKLRRANPHNRLKIHLNATGTTVIPVCDFTVFFQPGYVKVNKVTGDSIFLPSSIFLIMLL